MRALLNSDRLPLFLRTRLQGRDTLRRALDNSFWLFCDQILRMVAGLSVGVWMARYLGPEDYGWLNYAVATVGMVAALTSPAIGASVVREIARAPDQAMRWMGAAFFLRTAGASLAFLACVVIAGLRSDHESPAGLLTVIVAAGLLVQIVDVAELHLQARGESRVAAWVRMAACVAGAALKGALIMAHAPLVAFAIAGGVELALAGVGWLWAAKYFGGGILTWRCEQERVLELLRETWPLALASVAITVQAFADQLVIGAFLGGEELGQYAAATRLVAAFAFVPMVVHTVSAPEIARAKQDDETLYQRRLHSLYRLMCALFLVTGLPLMVLGPMAAQWLYGGSYTHAAALLPLLAWRLFFTNLGVARSIFIVNEGLLRFGLVTSLAGAVVNVALNLVLVPRWGAEGAIVAALASFAVTTFALESFDRRARKNLQLMARAVLLPWRPFVA